MENTPHSPLFAATQTQPPEQIKQISQWFETAVPEPTDRNILTQLGVHFEEVFEMAQTLKDAGMTKEARDQLTFVGDVLHFVQRQIKGGVITIDFEKIDRTALLNSLCDQIVTAVGVAHIFGMDIQGALKEVANSNDSKFGKNSQPIFNNQSKFMKGPNHKSRNLEGYTTRGDNING